MHALQVPSPSILPITLRITIGTYTTERHYLPTAEQLWSMHSTSDNPFERFREVTRWRWYGSVVSRAIPSLSFAR